MSKSRRNFGSRREASESQPAKDRMPDSMNAVSDNGNGNAAGAAAPAGTGLQEFLSRDLTWLEFNRRVLHEALDDRTPLLERLRFLGIFTSNLDEYFMKRVGGLKRQIAAGVVAASLDGMTPTHTLAAIRASVAPMLAQQAACYKDVLRPALAENGIHLLEWSDLTDEEREAATRYFRATVFPVLTPLAVDPGIPFPFISNLSTSLAVVLHHPDKHENLFARLKVPEVLPKWISVTQAKSGGPQRFVSLITLIRENLQDLFPDMAVVDVMPFRVTRNADLERDEEEAEDLLELMEEEIRQRRFAQMVRLEYGPNTNHWSLEFLMRELQLAPEDLYEMPGELDYDDLRIIADINLPRLRYEPWSPMVPARFADEDADIFNVIRNGDVLVHLPYESFSASVERFVRTAAADPNVLAIKMTLYRTGDESSFLQMLIGAAEAGKQVVCLVELKARFDEARNIHLAAALEKAGVHVVYGIVGLKTHTKTTLVVRQDPDGIRSYVHIGTGNYHAGTAKLYTDLGLFTCDPGITHDVIELFHYLTGRSLKRDYRKLLVAPVNMQARFLDLIEREVTNHRAGKPARIIAKMNSLEDRKVCRALYQASQAGVKIDLIVRGFCVLRPGVAGMSENISVISIIGRFLEHSRIFYFRNAAADELEGDFFIGSADWMYRNLLARVEAAAPVEKRPLRERLWEILQILLKDHRQAWEMRGDGSYVQRKPAPGEVGTQQTLMTMAKMHGFSKSDPQLVP
jgi:polyphosphate kinase